MWAAAFPEIVARDDYLVPIGEYLTNQRVVAMFCFSPPGLFTVKTENCAKLENLLSTIIDVLMLPLPLHGQGFTYGDHDELDPSMTGDLPPSITPW